MGRDWAFVGCWWLLFVVAGCLLVVVGCCWLSMVVDGCRWALVSCVMMLNVGC